MDASGVLALRRVDPQIEMADLGGLLLSAQLRRARALRPAGHAGGHRREPGPAERPAVAVQRAVTGG